MKIKSTLVVSLGLVIAAFARLPAAESAGAQNFAPMQVSAAAVQKVSFSPAARVFTESPLPVRASEERQELVFSAPPHETEAEAQRIYQPVAEYLTRILGKKVVFQYPQDWLAYQREMQRGNYDLIFDGPHFNSWRISHLQYSALAKLADNNAYVVVVRQEDNITGLAQLAGQKICGMTPPDLGTLAVLGQFDNPVRQPFIVNTLGSTKVYESVAVEKQCAAGIMPLASLSKIPGGQNKLRVIYQTASLPGQTFSASPRISRTDQARLAAALVSLEASKTMRGLLSANDTSRGLDYANAEDYAGLDAYLNGAWGYNR